MRDLSPFEDCSFDTIIAISNVFDAVCHLDRLTVLTEVHRVLKPGGLLFFSAHNRNYIGIGSGPRLLWHRNPLTQIHLLSDYWKASRHHRQLKPQQRFESDYALINDSGNNYSSLHYYVSRNNQMRQLVEAGFEPLECLDSVGCILTVADCDAEFPSIHYVARKQR
jgi:SAM-dependent methyltransferase